MTPQHTRRAWYLLRKALDQGAFASAGLTADKSNLAGNGAGLAQMARELVELGLTFQKFHPQSIGQRTPFGYRRRNPGVRGPQSG